MAKAGAGGIDGCSCYSSKSARSKGAEDCECYDTAPQVPDLRV